MEQNKNGWMGSSAKPDTANYDNVGTTKKTRLRIIARQYMFVCKMHVPSVDYLFNHLVYFSFPVPLNA